MTRLADWLRKLPARIGVLVRAVPTYGLAATTVVAITADELAGALPDQAQTVAAWAARITVAVGAAVAIARRVTPVPKAERGLLPPDA